jgi:hypothetical protein
MPFLARLVTVTVGIFSGTAASTFKVPQRAAPASSRSRAPVRRAGRRAGRTFLCSERGANIQSSSARGVDLRPCSWPMTRASSWMWSRPAIWSS